MVTDDGFDFDIHDIIRPRGEDDWRPQGNDIFLGPMEPTYLLVSNGYRVPHLTASPLRDGRWFLTLDERIGTEAVSEEEIRRWLPFLANAMAVAAGYSCHGDYSQVPNPYKVGVSRIDVDEDLEPEEYP